MLFIVVDLKDILKNALERRSERRTSLWKWVSSQWYLFHTNLSLLSIAQLGCILWSCERPNKRAQSTLSFSIIGSSISVLSNLIEGVFWMRTTEQVGDGALTGRIRVYYVYKYTVVRLKTVMCNIIYIFHFTDNYF